MSLGPAHLYSGEYSLDQIDRLYKFNIRSDQERTPMEAFY